MLCCAFEQPLERWRHQYPQHIPSHLSKPIPQMPSTPYGNQTKPRYDKMLGAEYMLPLFLKEYILPFWGVMHHQSSPNPTHVHFHKTCDEILLISVEQLEHFLLSSGFPCGSQSCWCYRIPGLKQTNSKCMVWPTHVPTTVFVCKTDKPALFSSLL